MNISARDYDFPPDLVSSYNHVLDFNFHESRQLAVEFNPQYPKEAIFRIILLSMADVIEISLTDNIALYRKYLKNESRYISALRDMDDSEWKTYALAEVNLHWAYVKFRMGENISGTLHFIRSREFIEKGIKENPDFLPFYRISGIINIVLGIVPEKYSWMLNLFGYKADIQKGIADLEKCINASASIFSRETFYILEVMHAYIIPDSFETINKKKGNSALDNKLIIKYINSLISIKNRNIDDALLLLDNFLVTDHPGRFPVIYYHVAECYLKKGDFVSAAIFYKSFLQNFNGSNLVIDANYKLSIIYYLNNDQETANKYRKLAGEYKVTANTGYDKNAIQQIKDDKWPEKNLYMARMAYDGGYYDRALELLDDYKTLHQSTWEVEEEFHYRSARIYHAKNQLNMAISTYQKTIELSEMKRGYYGPNSALNLGYIYTISGQKEKARKYFNKVFAYKNYGYKSSLDTQASLALQVLDE